MRYAALLFLGLSLGLTGCSKDTSVYSESKREEMLQESLFVVKASYSKTIKMTDRSLIDIVEGRKGFSDKLEQAVLFKIKEFLKGDYGKDEIVVGVNLPSLAFGISPAEYSGQKIYTLYVGYSQKLKRNVLIGAEWEPKKY